MTTHTLYRFFDGTGELLYVGRTVSPSRRWREHERGAAWYDAVASMTREVYPTAEAVDQAERVAIAAEEPMHNIALNSAVQRAGVTKRPTPPVDVPATLASRWALLGLDADDIAELADCLGDETTCECPACHDRRLCGLEDARSKYDWHPDLEAEIDEVERRYYAGHDLTDWYYDYFDIEMFARMRLASESRERPIPAYVTLGDQTAGVDCPICFNEHKHVLMAGMALNKPLEAPCRDGSFYTLVDDWDDMQMALEAWGKLSARAVAA